MYSAHSTFANWSVWTVASSHQFVTTAKPARGVGAYAYGVLPRVVGGEGEATIGGIVPGEHHSM